MFIKHLNLNALKKYSYHNIKNVLEVGPAASECGDWYRVQYLEQIFVNI